MSGGTAYIFKGHGSIEPDWVRDCFRLFRDRAVNIRKLVLLRDGQPEHFAMLEIQFVLPASEAEIPESNAKTGDFLEVLEARVASQRWNEQSLTPLA